MRSRVALLTLLSALSAGRASAQVPEGAEFQVNTYTAKSQDRASVASDAAGNFVVVWSSWQDGSEYGVFAQRYDASGGRRGSEFRVNTYTTFRQWKPSVAAGSAGNFVVVWWSERQDGSSNGVFAQRYDASGAPQGIEFQVNTYTTNGQCCASVASDAAGNFVVAWASNYQDGSSHGVFAQRYDASGFPRGSEFRVNVKTSGVQTLPSVASDAAGNFVVAWQSTSAGYGQGFDVVARRFDSSGAPRGAEFRVNDYRTWHQFAPAVAVDAAGSFVVAWEDGYQEGVQYGYGIFAHRYDSSGVPLGSEFHINTYLPGWQRDVAVASTATARFVVVWTSSPHPFDQEGQDGDQAGVFGRRLAGAILPAALAVDSAPSGGSDGNGVLEPGEMVEVKPSWRNVTGAPQTFDGNGLSFDGPAANGVSYQLLDGIGVYGAVADGATATCTDCYEVGVTFGRRPSPHWDATLTERLTPSGQTTPWSMHVGGSFVDVARTSPYYRFVETLLHRGVTVGCASRVYCPSVPTTREQMAAFALLGREGAGYVPYWCAPPDMFADVPYTSPFCAFIEELARRGVVSGCGGGNFCPGDPVSREQMAIFALRTLDPMLDPLGCGTPMFNDVPASSPFCRWIEELARRGVVGGCGGGNYCPTSPVTREQMAVFITGTYGLSLYGP